MIDDWKNGRGAAYYFLGVVGGCFMHDDQPRVLCVALFTSGAGSAVNGERATLNLHDGTFVWPLSVAHPVVVERMQFSISLLSSLHDEAV